jgi:hypothetical protein
VEAKTGEVAKAANTTIARLARKESTLVHLKNNCFSPDLALQFNQLSRIAAREKASASERAQKGRRKQ